MPEAMCNGNILCETVVKTTFFLKMLFCFLISSNYLVHQDRCFVVFMVKV